MSNKRIKKKQSKVQKEAQNWNDFLTFFEAHIATPATWDEIKEFVTDKILENGD